MAGLLARVRSRLFIRSTHRSMHPLDGAYASLHHGRSLDVEDLREYQPGDEVRDIDWKATARYGEPFVKRMRTTRRHTVLLAVDSSASMRALAEDDTPKRDLAILITGALGLLAVRHGDEVAIVHGDAGGIRRERPTSGESGLERALRAVDAAMATSQHHGDRPGLLDAVVRSVSRRMIMVVVTDEAPVTADEERLIRRLRVQHDLLWVTIRDGAPVLESDSARPRVDVDSAWQVPAFLHGDREVLAEIRAMRDAEDTRRRELFDRVAVSHAEIGGRDDAVAGLLAMLERRSHVG